jgi:hypothetical protein
MKSCADSCIVSRSYVPRALVVLYFQPLVNRQYFNGRREPGRWLAINRMPSPAICMSASRTAHIFQTAERIWFPDRPISSSAGSRLTPKQPSPFGCSSPVVCQYLMFMDKFRRSSTLVIDLSCRLYLRSGLNRPILRPSLMTPPTFRNSAVHLRTRYPLRGSIAHKIPSQQHDPQHQQTHQQYVHFPFHSP